MWYWWILIEAKGKHRMEYSRQGFATEDQARLNLEARTMRDVPNIKGFSREDFIADCGVMFYKEGFPR